jgi:hypothetical protein
VRYHVLKAGVTIRNVVVCLGLVAGSYLVSGLVNASPVTQPALIGPRSRGVIVLPPTSTPEEVPASRRGSRIADDRAIQSH